MPAVAQEIERQLRAPAPEPKEEPAAKQQQPQQQEEGAKEEESAPPPPKVEEEAPPAPKAEAAAVEVGDGVDVPLADPMALIKSGEVPVLSSEAKKTGESPLEFMVQARPSRHSFGPSRHAAGVADPLLCARSPHVTGRQHAVRARGTAF